MSYAGVRETVWEAGGDVPGPSVDMVAVGGLEELPIYVLELSVVITADVMIAGFSSYGCIIYAYMLVEEL